MGQQHLRGGGIGSDVRAAVIEDTRAKIARHGWTVIGVFPAPGDSGVAFAYTVGLSAKLLGWFICVRGPVRSARRPFREVVRQHRAAERREVSWQS